jgi:hypothetical protein
MTYENPADVERILLDLGATIGEHVMDDDVRIVLSAQIEAVRQMLAEQPEHALGGAFALLSGLQALRPQAFGREPLVE